MSYFLSIFNMETLCAGSTIAIPATWTRCLEYLPLKKRYCTGIRNQGSDLCGAHIKQGRIPCPVDPSHTIFGRDVEKHTKRCTRTTMLARISALPCFSTGINAGCSSPSEESELVQWRKLWNVEACHVEQNVTRPDIDVASFSEFHPAPDVLALTRMLQQLDLAMFAARVAGWAEQFCVDQAARAVCSTNGDSADTDTRHQRQALRIVAAMKAEGLLLNEAVPQADTHTRTLLVEFGAGKGLLGVTIQHAAAALHSGATCTPIEVPQLILLERGANRFKADRLLRLRSGALAGPDSAAGAINSGVDSLESAEALVSPSATAASSRLPPPPPPPPPRHEFQRIRMDIADFMLEAHPAASHGVSLSAFTRLPLWANAGGHSNVAAEGAHVTASGSASAVAGSAGSAKRRRVSLERTFPESLERDASGGHSAVESGDYVPVAVAPGRDSVQCVEPCEGGDLRKAELVRVQAGEPDIAGKRDCDATAGDAVTETMQATGSSVDKTPSSVIAIGKHLCGGATDLALRCLIRSTLGAARAGDAAGDIPGRCSSTAAPGELSTDSRPCVGGVAIATCCHHLCSWTHYVGKAFFRDVLGAGPVEFETMRMLSSWGLLGNAPQQQLPAGATTAPALLPVDAAHHILDRTQRLTLGRQCKSLIDAGRVAFLRASLQEGGGVGSTASSPAVAHMLAYCPAEDSPENMLLIAKPRPSVARS